MKTFKKVLSFILAVSMMLSVMSFSVFADEAESVTLTDIDASTAVGKAVSRLVSLGIINGYPDGTFKPDNTITRAEFCVVMVKFEGMQDYINPDAYTGFEDLDTDENYAWVRPYVAMAVSRGIINGFEDGTFRAADPVTYEQAIKMIICSLGYQSSAQMPTILNDWSSGYIAKAMQLGVTKSTSIVNKTNPTTRGTVAILTSNALDAEKNDLTTSEGDKILDGSKPFEELDYKEVKGLVTGTYVTELESSRSYVPKNHIQIEDEIYEIGFSRNPNELLGCYVEATIYTDSDGEYDLVKSIAPAKKNEVITVKAGLVEDYEDGELVYFEDDDSREKTVKIEDEYITIFNNKYDESYDISELKSDLENGYVDLVDNDGDGKVEVVRVNSYEVYVVASKSNSSQKITLMYDAEYDGSNTMMFPEDSTSLIFSLTRNGKEIKFSDIAKWDVLNIKRSDEDLEGRRYYEVEVTRETASGLVNERDNSDESYIVVNDKEYVIADSYLDLLEEAHEDAVTLEAGDTVQVYLDSFGQIVAAAKATSTNSAESYAYLLSLRQDSDKSEYDLEFWLYTTSGKYLQIGSADKITIDGTKYKALDEDIVDYLEDSATQANRKYLAAENVLYQQPIIYQTNSDGLVSVIHTVNSTENEDISQTMIDEDEDLYYAEYKERKYSSSSRSFADFKVSSSTKIIFVPDDRGDTDNYLTFSSYSKAFSNAREYHVEAYGLTSSGTAALVLLYHENDSRIYTSSTPWMIVASKSQTASGTVLKGYQGTSYSLKSITVDEEDGPSVSAIGKGDIIRYILNSEGDMIDYQVWFDASNPVQLNPVNDKDELYVETDNDTNANRIIEIHSTNTEPRKQYPSATFRLQFGTVTEIILDEDGTVDEETIDIAPVIYEDGLEIDAFDASEGEQELITISKVIGSSVKVFSYDATSRNSEVLTEVELSEILDYDEYEWDASRVIAYTASGTLRMIYIVTVEAE